MRVTSNFRLVTILIGIGGFCCLASARCEEFSWEVSGAANRVEVGNATRTDGLAVRATYYTRPVDDTRGPYATAAFLNRSSRLTVATTRTEERSQLIVASPISGPIPQSTELESSAYMLSGRYVWQRTGWYVGGAMDRSDTDWPESEFSQTDSKVTGHGIFGGKYLGEATALELAFRTTTLTVDVTQMALPGTFPFPMPAFSGRNETETEDFGLSVFHVGELGRMSYAVSGQAHSSRAEFRAFVLTSDPTPGTQFSPVPGTRFISDGTNAAPLANPLVVTRDRVHSYSVAAEFFPTTALGFRAGYSRWDDDPAQDSSYQLAATWFFKRAIAARVSFARTKRDIVVPGLTHLDNTTLELFGRF